MAKSFDSIFSGKSPLLFGIVALSVLLGCVEVKTNEQGLSNVVTQDRAIFFKNLRQSNYLVTEYQEAGINSFRHKKSNSFQTYVVINHHWRDDKASVMLNFDNIETPVKLVISREDSIFESSFEGANIEEHLITTLNLYKALSSDFSIFAATNPDTLEILSDAEEKKIFQITVKDYLILTGNVK